MENGLSTTQNHALVTALQAGELGSVLQPLVKEIHLFDTFVAGTMKLKDETVLADLSVGQTLLLERENDKFDENEIVIRKMDDIHTKIGYIPRQDNLIFARLMDAGKALRAKINAIDFHHDISKISIGIYLIDV